jgi:uncharacterized protein (TIGR03437 family)
MAAQTRKANPARPGETITLYGSSFGQTLSPSQDGQINRAALPLAGDRSIDVRDGNDNRLFPAQILFAGAAAGVAQVNFVAPQAATQSEQSSISGQTSLLCGLSRLDRICSRRIANSR